MSSCLQRGVKNLIYSRLQGSQKSVFKGMVFFNVMYKWTSLFFRIFTNKLSLRALTFHTGLLVLNCFHYPSVLVDINVVKNNLWTACAHALAASSMFNVDCASDSLISTHGCTTTWDVYYLISLIHCAIFTLSTTKILKLSVSPTFIPAACCKIVTT